MNSKSQTFKEYSRDFEFGIFQSIGFKEFDEYFKLLENEEQDDGKKRELFEKGIEDMKASTRRYAKTQIKWVKNVFLKSSFLFFINSIFIIFIDFYQPKGANQFSPIVHELDTSDLEKWNENIFAAEIEF